MAFLENEHFVKLFAFFFKMFWGFNFFVAILSNLPSSFLVFNFSLVSVCCLGNPSVVGVIFLCPYVLSLDTFLFSSCVYKTMLSLCCFSLLPFLFPAMKALSFFLSGYLTFQPFHIGLVDRYCNFSFFLCVQPLYFTRLCVTPLAICHTFLLLALWGTFLSECLRVVTILVLFKH